MKLGINYLSESMHPLKSFSQIRKDLEEMKRYGFEGIRISGNELSWLLKIAKEAKRTGLQVWLSPRFAHNKPMLTREEYLQEMKEFAKEAEKQSIDVFLVGNELSLELKDFAEIQGYENRCGQNWLSFEKQFEGRKTIFREYLTLLIEEAKKFFSGPVAYAAGTWELDSISWSEFDIVSANLYLWKRFTEKQYEETLEKLKKHGKPVVITEFGFTSTKEAWEIGPRHIYETRKFPIWIRNFLISNPSLVRGILKFNPKILLRVKIPHHYDEETQKLLMKKNLEILVKSEVDQAFVFQWWEPWKAGFGLTHNGTATPKKALSLFPLKP
jgi:hypothetical protein